VCLCERSKLSLRLMFTHLRMSSGCWYKRPWRLNPVCCCDCRSAIGSVF
jgi:hypothetical protein